MIQHTAMQYYNAIENNINTNKRHSPEDLFTLLTTLSGTHFNTVAGEEY